MIIRTALMSCLMIAAGATCIAQKADLAVAEINWRLKPHTVQLVITNLGLSKAPMSTGGYVCQSAPNEKGYSVSFGVQFTVPELLPNQKWKTVLNCNKNKIKGAGLDTDNKVLESNEANNAISFAEVQQNKGPIKKPGS